MTANVFDEGHSNKAAKDPDLSLALLSELRAKAMLEPYILFVLPDAGIAQDYPAYKAANREKLVQFIDEYILPPTPQP